MAFRCNKRITIVSAGLHQNPYNVTNKVNIFQHDTYISPFPISTNDRGYCIQILITRSSNDNNIIQYNIIVFHMKITDCNEEIVVYQNSQKIAPRKQGFPNISVTGQKLHTG